MSAATSALLSAERSELIECYRRLVPSQRARLAEKLSGAQQVEDLEQVSTTALRSALQAAEVRPVHRITDMILTRMLTGTPAWMLTGTCATSDVDHMDPTSADAALINCARCPVLASCVSWVQDNPVSTGVWGGSDQRHDGES